MSTEKPSAAEAGIHAALIAALRGDPTDRTVTVFTDYATLLESQGDTAGAALFRAGAELHRANLTFLRAVRDITAALAPAVTAALNALADTAAERKK